MPTPKRRHSKQRSSKRISAKLRKFSKKLNLDSFVPKHLRSTTANKK